MNEKVSNVALADGKAVQCHQKYISLDSSTTTPNVPVPKAKSGADNGNKTVINQHLRETVKSNIDNSGNNDSNQTDQSNSKVIYIDNTAYDSDENCVQLKDNAIIDVDELDDSLNYYRKTKQEGQAANQAREGRHKLREHNASKMEADEQKAPTPTLNYVDIVGYRINPDGSEAQDSSCKEGDPEQSFAKHPSKPLNMHKKFNPLNIKGKTTSTVYATIKSEQPSLDSDFHYADGVQEYDHIQSTIETGESNAEYVSSSSLAERGITSPEQQQHYYPNQKQPSHHRHQRSKAITPTDTGTSLMSDSNAQFFSNELYDARNSFISTETAIPSDRRDHFQDNSNDQRGRMGQNRTAPIASVDDHDDFKLEAITGDERQRRGGTVEDIGDIDGDDGNSLFYNESYCDLHSAQGDHKILDPSSLANRDDSLPDAMTADEAERLLSSR